MSLFDATTIINRGRQWKNERRIMNELFLNFSDFIFIIIVHVLELMLANLYLCCLKYPRAAVGNWIKFILDDWIKVTKKNKKPFRILMVNQHLNLLIIFLLLALTFLWGKQKKKCLNQCKLKTISMEILTKKNSTSSS